MIPKKTKDKWCIKGLLIKMERKQIKQFVCQPRSVAFSFPVLHALLKAILSGKVCAGEGVIYGQTVSSFNSTTWTKGILEGISLMKLFL